MLQKIKDTLLTELKGNKKLQPANDGFVLPIKSIDDLILSDDGFYKIVLKISPINTDMMTDDEVLEVSESINNVLISYQGRYQILLQRERIDIDTTINYYKDFQNTLNEELKIELLENNIETLKDYKDSNNRIFSFYLVMEIKEKDYILADKILDDYYRSILNELSNQDIFVEKLTKHEISNNIYQRLNPESSLNEPYESNLPLESIYPEYAKRLKDGRHIQIENDIYRFYSINFYYQEVKEFMWMKKLFNYNGNIIISFIMTPKDKAKITEELNKAYKKSRIEVKQNEDKDMAETKKAEKSMSSAEQLMESALSSNNQIFDLNLTIAIYEKSIDQLDTQSRLLKSSISEFGRSSEIRNKGYMPFYNTLPILPKNKITDDYVWNFTSFDVASIIPFDSSQLMDEKGFLLADNISSGGIILLDKYNRIYDNPHMTIIGNSGTGKSFSIGLQNIRELPFLDYIIQFDLDGSAIYPWMNSIEFSTSSKIITNPFHIRSTILSDDDNFGHSDLGMYLSTKIMDLIVFFKWIHKDMTPYEESLLEEDLRDCYFKLGITFDSKELPKEFPTFSTLKDIMSSKYHDKDRTQKERETRQDMLTIFRPYIEGAYASMFNGQTNWDYKLHNVFKLHKTPEAIQKQLYDLLLKDSWEFGKKDGTLDRMDKKIYKKYIIDEQHIFADPNKPQTLEFISTQLNKQSRKFGISVVNATQQANDLLVIPKHGQAILDNSYFKMLFRLGEGDHEVVQKLYGLSDKEMNLLKGGKRTKKNKGRGIFIAGNQRVYFYSKPSKFELSILDPNQYEELYKVKTDISTEEKLKYVALLNNRDVQDEIKIAISEYLSKLKI
ncbi:MAG: hypothetical protein AB7V16_11370 [Vulcanibacillus sp.]